MPSCRDWVSTNFKGSILPLVNDSLSCTASLQTYTWLIAVRHSRVKNLGHQLLCIIVHKEQGTPAWRTKTLEWSRAATIPSHLSALATSCACSMIFCSNRSILSTTQMTAMKQLWFLCSTLPYPCGWTAPRPHLEEPSSRDIPHDATLAAWCDVYPYHCLWLQVAFSLIRQRVVQYRRAETQNKLHSILISSSKPVTVIPRYPNKPKYNIG